MDNWLQLAIGALIVALVLFSVWRHGRLNPDSTGAVGRRLGKVETEMAGMKETLERCATREAFGLLAEKVASLEGHAASSGEVVALEAKVMGVCDTLSAKIDGVEKIVDRTDEGVRRIEGYFLAKGVERT